jgi:hypothetical protein
VANVVGTASTFVTTLGEGTLTFTDPEGGQTIVEPFVLTVGQGDRTGREGRPTTCATTFTDQDPVLGEVSPTTLRSPASSHPRATEKPPIRGQGVAAQALNLALLTLPRGRCQPVGFGTLGMRSRRIGLSL